MTEPTGSGPAATVVRVRPATRADVEQMWQFMAALAAHEGDPTSFTATVERLTVALFGERPLAEALIAEIGSEPVGYALFYGTFSGWECLPAMWLHDLFVADAHRGGGAGRALLSEVARIALARGCVRLEWHALSDNEAALGFYRRVGAEREPSWDLHELRGAALERVAAGSS